MSAIMIKCPETGREVDVGIDTDPASFEAIPDSVASLQCPACGAEHEWKISEAWLRERETTQQSENGLGAEPA